MRRNLSQSQYDGRYPITWGEEAAVGCSNSTRYTVAAAQHAHRLRKLAALRRAEEEEFGTPAPLGGARPLQCRVALRSAQRCPSRPLWR